MTPPRDANSIRDMLRAAELIREFTNGLTQEELAEDVMRQSAVERQLEILGEAANRVSEETRARHPELPWHEIVGMRTSSLTA